MWRRRSSDRARAVLRTRLPEFRPHHGETGLGASNYVVAHVVWAMDSAARVRGGRVRSRSAVTTAGALRRVVVHRVLSSGLIAQTASVASARALQCLSLRWRRISSRGDHSFNGPVSDEGAVSDARAGARARESGDWRRRSPDQSCAARGIAFGARTPREIESASSFALATCHQPRGM